MLITLTRIKYTVFAGAWLSAIVLQVGFQLLGTLPQTVVLALI